MNKKVSNTKGAIALMASIILGAVIVSIIISISLLGISSRANTFHLIQSEQVLIKADGCLEEALIKLNRDNAYTGGSISLDGVNCTASISGIGDERTVQITRIESPYTRDLQIQAQVNPSFGILSWQE